MATLSTTFGLLSLLLAAIGQYGVIAYSVSERTREIGIRMALGARTPQVIWMVMRRTAVLFAAGIALGLASALALGKYIQSLLYGVSPTDAVAITVTVVALGLTAVLASYVPSRRATRVDPTAALRYE